MKERRLTKQIEVLDKNGELEYTIIPNYKIHKNFLTINELKFYKFLIIVVQEIRKKFNINLQIFTQVALNRIIDVNNERKNEELFDKISRKSIDFVLYNDETNEILCCIELDDETHNSESRKKRDELLDKVFENNIKLLHLKRQNYYNLEEIVNLIMS